MAFCVLRISDYQLLYLGLDEAAARALVDEGVHLASGQRPGNALIRAAIEVGHIRRGKGSASVIVDAGRDYTLSDGLLCKLTGLGE